MTSRSTVRGTWRLALLVGLGTIAAGCFTTAENFKRDAEDYIDSTVAEALDVSFESVVCTAPVDQDIGTRFECTALDDAGGTWVFDNEITDDREFTVNVFSRP